MLRCLVSRIIGQHGRPVLRNPCNPPLPATHCNYQRTFAILRHQCLTDGLISSRFPSSASTRQPSAALPLTLSTQWGIRNFYAKGSKVRYLDFRFRFKTSHYKSHLLIIRRQKMKKHRKEKWRKKFKSLLAKKRLKREIAKEKTFRVELLTMIKRAEQFDPRAYALKKIHEANNAPRPMTKEERHERTLDLVRKHRYQTDYVKPKHRRMDTLEDYS